MNHLTDCIDAVFHSQLGEVYFDSEDDVQTELIRGIAKEDFYVAVGDDNACLGFIWFVPNGAFHTYPYVHIIAVKQDHRGKGIGRRLLAYSEKRIFTEYAKMYLLVGDFNVDARRLYETIGYVKVAEIPDLHAEGVTEYLMMKRKPDTGKDPARSG